MNPPNSDKHRPASEDPRSHGAVDPVSQLTSGFPLPRRSWLRAAGGAALATVALARTQAVGAQPRQLPPDFIPWNLPMRRNRDGREIKAVVRSIRGHRVDGRIDGRAFELDARELDPPSRTMLDYLQIRGRVTPLQLPQERAAEIRETGLHAMRYERPTASMQMPFMLYEPPEARERRRDLPLVMFLHGNGGRGTDGYMNFADAGKAPRHFIDPAFQRWLPSFVYIPQSADQGSLWSNTSYFRPREILLRAVQCIDVLKARYGYSIDMRRIYITGLSSGGTGCYEAIAKFPGKFAAAIPIACNHDPQVFYRANAAPVWYFANRNDGAVCFQAVDRLAAHFRSLGSEHRVTLLAGRGHNAWNEVYGNQEFRGWLSRRELRQELYPTDYRVWLDEEEREREDQDARPV